MVHDEDDDLPHLSVSFEGIQLTSLVHLRLNWSSMSHTLHTLNISNNKLQNFLILDASLPRMPALRTLNISNNRLSHLLPKAMRAFPHLLDMDVSYNRLLSITGLRQLPRLRSLSLRGNKLDSRAMCDLRGLRCIRYLDVAYNNISDLKWMSSSQNSPLIELWMNNNPVTQHNQYFIVVFATAPRLRMLDGVFVPSDRKPRKVRSHRSPLFVNNRDVVRAHNNSNVRFNLLKNERHTSKRMRFRSTEQNVLWQKDSAVATMKFLMDVASKSTFSGYSLSRTKSKLDNAIKAKRNFEQMRENYSNPNMVTESKTSTFNNTYRLADGIESAKDTIELETDPEESRKSFQATTFLDYSLNHTKNRLCHILKTETNVKSDRDVHSSRSSRFLPPASITETKRSVSLLGFPLSPESVAYNKAMETFTIAKRAEAKQISSAPCPPFAALSLDLNVHEFIFLKKWMRSIAAFEDFCTDVLLRLIQQAGVSDGMSSHATGGRGRISATKLPKYLIAPIRHTPQIINMAKRNQRVAAAVSGVSRRISKLQHAVAHLRQFMASSLRTPSEINKVRATLLKDDILQRPFTGKRMWLRLGQFARLQVWLQMQKQTFREAKLRYKWQTSNNQYNKQPDSDTKTNTRYDQKWKSADGWSFDLENVCDNSNILLAEEQREEELVGETQPLVADTKYVENSQTLIDRQRILHERVKSVQALHRGRRWRKYFKKIKFGYTQLQAIHRGNTTRQLWSTIIEQSKRQKKRNENLAVSLKNSNYSSIEAKLEVNDRPKGINGSTNITHSLGTSMFNSIKDWNSAANEKVVENNNEHEIDEFETDDFESDENDT